MQIIDEQLSSYDACILYNFQKISTIKNITSSRVLFIDY